jgi:hypothetical protein
VLGDEQLEPARWLKDELLVKPDEICAHQTVARVSS